MLIVIWNSFHFGSLRGNMCYSRSDLPITTESTLRSPHTGMAKHQLLSARSSTICVHDLRTQVVRFAGNRTTNLSEHLVGAMRIHFSQRIEIVAERPLVTGVRVGVGNPLPRPGGILSIR